jgi:membrane protease YdiL (CAAX protease family)
MDHSIFFFGSVTAPPRSSRVATALVLSVIGALSLAMVAPDTAGKWVLAALAALLILAIVHKAIYATHIALLALIWIFVVGFIPHFQLWPLNLLAPLIVYGMVVVLTPHLRRSVGWLRAGHFGPDVRLIVIATVIVSSVALVFWTVFSKPDVQRHLALVPEMPFWIYPLAAIGFASINAAMEEIVFRGIMMEALDSALGETYRSVGVQAVSFAALHYLAGFPNGVLGFLMAFVYGIMLGVVRWRSKGLLAPWVAHVVADITIFATLAVILVQT